MTYKDIIHKTEIFVREYMNNLHDISHDYNHISLVVKLALKLAKLEGIYKQRDLFHIIMGALLHDVGDSKYSNEKQSSIIQRYLKKFRYLRTYDKIEIVRLASNVSLSKERDNFNRKFTKRNLKLFIIQDADRINSLGAIGVMRYISFNIINSDKPSFDEIITNMKKRTIKIKRYLKTSAGSRIANKHMKFIFDFIDNYQEFLK
jgi:uncharacterized protein